MNEDYGELCADGFSKEDNQVLDQVEAEYGREGIEYGDAATAALERYGHSHDDDQTGGPA